jgi:hypothetical protein
MSIKDIVSAAKATIERPALSDLNAKVQAVVTAMAAADAAVDQAKAMRDAAVAEAKAIFDATGLMDLEGAEGIVQVIVANGAQRIDAKLVRQLLTEEQVEAVTVTGAASTRVKFTARKGGPKAV